MQAMAILYNAGSFTAKHEKNLRVDFFEFLFSKFAACSKPPTTNSHRKASHPRTQYRDQGAG